MSLTARLTENLPRRSGTSAALFLAEESTACPAKKPPTQHANNPVMSRITRPPPTLQSFLNGALACRPARVHIGVLVGLDKRRRTAASTCGHTSDWGSMNTK